MRGMPAWGQGLLVKDVCLGTGLNFCEGCLPRDTAYFLRGMPAWGQGLLVKDACLGTGLEGCLSRDRA
ncbi:UNVERIFIED_CONTAM: hypothetical protein Slati_2263700 [Sesamum latifolium]|uniref:Uncharacterized protein n=1 Tax=Sesamum latifolium TaxID=2727402 RepID=A0AAW2WZG3_9LAMI